MDFDSSSSSEEHFHKLADTPAPITRWTRPGFIEAALGKKKPDNFFIEKLTKPLSPIDLNIGNIHYRWVDGFWVNIGSDYEAATTKINREQAEKYAEENADLSRQIELLLDMNTEYELRKAKKREKLRMLEDQIRHFPGLELDDF